MVVFLSLGESLPEVVGGHRMDSASALAPVTGACHAFLQPYGGWGLSNSGLVVGRGESLLVDTLFDLAHTRRMLASVAGPTTEAPITTVVNTHGNGDHWFGNELVGDVEIIASEATVEDMRAVLPSTVDALKGMPGATGDYAREIFGAFEFAGITPTFPTRTFTGETHLTVGGVEVLLIDVGPAHTSGDTIVFCPQDRVAFTGDIVFAGGTPIVWSGPFANYVAACRRILDLGAETLVPGHGPVSPAARVEDMIDYLEFVHDQAERRFDAGMTAQEAALDIDLGAFAAWPEAERVAVNVATAYRELGASSEPPAGPALFGCMAELAHRGRGSSSQAGGD